MLLAIRQLINLNMALVGRPANSISPMAFEDSQRLLIIRLLSLVTIERVVMHFQVDLT
jgi:hypothetical protein